MKDYIADAIEAALAELLKLPCMCQEGECVRCDACTPLIQAKDRDTAEEESQAEKN